MGAVRTQPSRPAPLPLFDSRWTSLDHAANLPTNIVDFGGFASSIMLCLRGGILMSIGDFPEDSSQAMLVGIMSVGRLGVHRSLWSESALKK